MHIEANLQTLALVEVKMFIIYWGIKYTTHNLKLSPHRLCLYYRERGFPTGKIRTFHSNQVTKLSIINKETNWDSILPNRIRCLNTIYVIFLPRMFNLNLILRKPSQNSGRENSSLCRPFKNLDKVKVENIELFQIKRN